MATSINLNGKTITRPGVYALIKSGIKNPVANLSTGNICIIDDGLGASWSGGAGVKGTFASGIEAIYELTSAQQMRDFVKGGELWNLAKPLFKPAGNNTLGTSKVFYVRAATTTPSLISLSFANGSIAFNTIDEGVGANGVLNDGNLIKGYAIKFVADSIDPNKYVVQFYSGVFRGIDPLNNTPYDNINAVDSTPSVVLATTPCSTIQELLDWCAKSTIFKAIFKVKEHTITTTGAFVTEDLVTNVGYQLASGGTEVFDSTSYDAAIEAIQNVDNTFFLSTSYGVVDSIGLNNTKLFDYILNESKYEKFIVIGAGFDSSQYSGVSASSEAVAKYYNSDKVIVVHGGSKEVSREGFLVRSQLYKAAAVLGRICGLDPQTPCTLKSIGIDGEIHPLSDKELEYSLKVGVLTTYYDSELGYYVIQQGINTLQKNEFLINEEDASSFDIAVKRIVAALNKEISVKGKRRFFGNSTVGANRNTVSDEEVKLWLRGFLQSKVASTNTDNLILSFGNIESTISQDTVDVNYEFVPNGPVNKILITGTIIAG